MRTEETSGRKHSMETWLAMAIPDPAFFLVGVDDGETPAYHEEFGEATAILARDGFLGTALALVGTEQIVLYLEYGAEGRLVRAAKMHHLHEFEPERLGANHCHVAARILEDLGVRRAYLATAEDAAEVVELRGGELEVAEYSRG